MLSEENVIRYCQVAIRIGARKELSFGVLRDREQMTRARFNRAWATAKAEEDLAARYPGLRKPD